MRKVLIIGNKVCDLNESLSLDEFDIVVRINKMDNYFNISGRTDILYINCHDDYILHNGGKYIDYIDCNNTILWLFSNGHNVYNIERVLDLFPKGIMYELFDRKSVHDRVGYNFYTSFYLMVLHFINDIDNEVHVVCCDIDDRYDILQYHESLVTESYYLRKFIDEGKLIYHE